MTVGRNSGGGTVGGSIGGYSDKLVRCERRYASNGGWGFV